MGMLAALSFAAIALSDTPLWPAVCGPVGLPAASPAAELGLVEAGPEEVSSVEIRPLALAVALAQHVVSGDEELPQLVSGNREVSARGRLKRTIGNGGR
jgi:hypothetical protein